MKGKRGEWPDAADTKPAEGETIAAPGETAPAAAPVAGEPAAAPDAKIKTYEKVTVTESVKHTFTQAELAELADKMATAAARVYDIEREKAEQAAHYSAELKTANLTAGALVTKYNLRYEMRDVECRVEYDKPEPGYKTYVRTDTGESVRDAPMTPAERQRAFVFDAGEGKPQ